VADIQLVLLPGMDGMGTLFRPFIEALPAQIRPHVVIYPRDRQLSFEELARHVADHWPEGDRVFLLAESFSGLVAVHLLKNRMKPVEGVIFCSGFAQPAHPTLLRLLVRLPGWGPFFRFMPNYFLKQPTFSGQDYGRLVNDLNEALDQVHPSVLRQRVALMAREKMMDTMRFEVPCLYLQGTNDRLVPPERAQWFREHFTRFDLERLEGPHLLLQANPEACARRVAAFVRDTE